MKDNQQAPLLLPLHLESGPSFLKSLKKHARHRKFRPGEKIESIADLARYLEHGQWIYVGSKPVHPSFLLCWQLQSLLGGIQRKAFRLAIRNSKQPEPSQE